MSLFVEIYTEHLGLLEHRVDRRGSQMAQGR